MFLTRAWFFYWKCLLTHNNSLLDINVSLFALPQNAGIFMSWVLVVLYRLILLDSSGVFQPLNIWYCGWSEPAATNAPVQNEAVQAVLGMNQKHILFPCSGISAPFSTPKISPPTYFPPPTSLHLVQSISKARESS